MKLTVKVLIKDDITFSITVCLLGVCVSRSQWNDKEMIRSPSGCHRSIKCLFLLMDFHFLHRYGKEQRSFAVMQK